MSELRRLDEEVDRILAEAERRASEILREAEERARQILGRPIPRDEILKEAEEILRRAEEEAKRILEASSSAQVEVDGDRLRRARELVVRAVAGLE
ncbi:MAG: hypothetical protein ABWK00_00025 [Desulfurococcaceae archaeon]